MSGDVQTIIGTLAALDVALFAWLRSDLKGTLHRLEDRMGAVEKEQARTTGLLECLGLTGRATPPSAPGAD